MKKMSVTVGLAALLVALMAAPAIAKPHYKSKVTLNYQPGTYSDSFFGTVKSNQKPACVKNRTVKVKREAPGDNVTVGSDTTDSDGDYSVNLGDYAEPGDYFAKAKKRVLNNGGVCDAAKSPVITVN